MAITTEKPDQQEAEKLVNKPAKPHNPGQGTAPNPFTFWFYFTIAVSIITLFFVSLSSLSPEDPKVWFLSLPNSLRQHYAEGRIIKVNTHSNQQPIEIFTVESGSVVSENVVLVHGLGLSSYSFREVIRSLGSNGVRAVAIDLPGNGFSDKSRLEVDEIPNGFLGGFWDVFSEIKEKGLFSAFDHIIETGQMPYHEIGYKAPERKSVKVMGLGPDEMGKVLGQVIETMGLAPVHLVLHDSALGLGANWVSENSGSVRSITFIDTESRSVGALPLWVLEMPVVREFVLGFLFVYVRYINLCCSKGINILDAEAQRALLRGRDGRRAVVAMGKNLNTSFDLADWASSNGLKDIPIQVLWSSGWSKEWSEEGRRVAGALPQANFAVHSGGRWPQEDASDELAENIVKFVSSLPKTVRRVEEEAVPENIQKMVDEAKSSDHHHHHSHDGHGYDDGHGAGYMDAYGLNHGWLS